MNWMKKIREFLLAFLNWLQSCLLDLADLFVLFIEQLFPVIILVPHEKTIGNTSEEIFFSMLLARAKGKKVILVRRFSFLGLPVICNREVFRLRGAFVYNGVLASLTKFTLSLYCSILTGWIPALIRFSILNIQSFASYPLHFILGAVGLTDRRRFKLRSRLEHCFFDLSLGVERLWEDLNTIENFKLDEAIAESPPLEIRPSVLAVCKNRLREMGINGGDWYVCVHVRDGGFWNDSEDYRNSSIDNYIPAMKEIVNRGGKVVRLGAPSSRPLPAIEGVFDYAHSSIRSEEMDLFLLKNCHIFVGQNSGVFDTTKLFQRRVVAVNVTEWAFGTPIFFGDLMLFKRFFSKSKNRFLSIEEMLSLPFEKLYFSPTTKDDEFELVENSAEEILEVVRESLDQDGDYQYSQLQNDFIERREQQARNWMEAPIRLGSILNKGAFVARIGSRAKGIRATLGKRFLEQNWSMRPENPK